MLRSAFAGAVNFQSVMLVLIVIASNIISVSMIIHGVNKVYRLLGGEGNLLMTKEDQRRERMINRMRERDAARAEYNRRRRAR